MGKFKAAKPKKAQTPPVAGGLPCVVLVVLGMILVMVLLYLVMKNAS
jgi:hypothetical protein